MKQILPSLPAAIDLEEDIFHFDQEPLRLLRVRDLDALVSRVSDQDFAEDERLPYWAELWPSAIAQPFLEKLERSGWNRTSQSDGVIQNGKTLQISIHLLQPPE